VKLENEFTVPATLDQAWAVLLDVERVAPCLPGAAVEPGSGEDGEFRGTMTVKIGPITSRYAGTVKVEEADVEEHRAVMRAQAKDARGQGSAAATITSTMEETPEGTRVKVVTDMRVTGPAAQFGRGVMQDVSAKLMRQFAELLAEEMTGAEAAPAAPPEASTWSSAAASAEPAAESPAAASEESSAAPPPESSAAPQPESAEESPATAPEPAPEESPAAPVAESPAAAPEESPAAPAAESPAAAHAEPPPPRPADTAPVRRAPEVLDLGEASREAVLKRAVPLVAGVVALLIVLRIIRRR
jgi:carbon monoxide dehydrogenase subunit G